MSPSSFISSNKTNRILWLLGETVTLKVTSEETGGKYSVCEIKVPPQSGPPPHYHTNLEEGFHILGGKFSFQNNGNVVDVYTGSFVHVPRGIVHTYKNTGNDVGKLLVIGIPAGLESFFDELGVPVVDERNFTPPPSNPYDIDKIVDISKKHGIIYSPALKS
jgi:quercetin dioxygenase-like cupin family protein